MNFTDGQLVEYCEAAAAGVDKRAQYWHKDSVLFEGMRSVIYAITKQVRYLATGAALYGATRQARQWFGLAARLRHQNIATGRLRRDIRERAIWEGEPRVFARAMVDALLSHDDAVVTSVAEDAIEMDECYLDEFAPDYPDFPAHYYNSKSKAALALGDPSAPEFVEQLAAATDELPDPGPFWQTAPTFYRAISAGEQSDAQAAAEDLLTYHLEARSSPDDPDEFVFHNLAALVVLADRQGTPVSLDSPRVPAAVTDPTPAGADRELDIDLSYLEPIDPVGLFDLDRDEDGTPILAARVYHAGGEPFTPADVPERPAGRVLDDEWVEAALIEAAWRDHFDDDLVADAMEAYEAHELYLKFVVVQDRADRHMFEGGVSKLVDGIEFLKAAGSSQP